MAALKPSVTSTPNSQGSHQLVLRRMSWKVLEGATKVSMTRSTWLSEVDASALITVSDMRTSVKPRELHLRLPGYYSPRRGTKIETCRAVENAYGPGVDSGSRVFRGG